MLLEQLTVSRPALAAISWSLLLLRFMSASSCVRNLVGRGTREQAQTRTKMFNNLANYILGTITNLQTEQAAGVVEETNLRLTPATAVDDDWVLVDRDSEGNSELSSDEEVDDEPDNLPLTIVTRTSSTSSLPCATMMEESWFLTPPPCFTSAGPVHMETSPLENLLIEHPSMSVYQHSQHFTTLLINRRRTTSLSAAIPVRAASVPSPAAEEEAESQAEAPAVATRGRVAHSPVRRNHRNDLVHRQERQTVKTKQAQKVQIGRTQQYLKRRYLERNNKAREVNTRNRRMRRGERSQGANRSHANNNRKC